MMIAKKQIDILAYIYQLRILRHNQIYQIFFMKYNTDGTYGGSEYCNKYLRNMIQSGYIAKIKYNGEKYYYILTKGIHVLQSQSVSWLGEGNGNIETYRQSAKVRVLEKNILHQTALNQFVLNFISKKYPVAWNYLDESYMDISAMKTFKPDGILIVEDSIYFLEMDMGTETRKQLVDKWMRYRKCFSKKMLQSYGKVTILFIQKDGTDTLYRKNMIISSIQEIIPDLVNGELLDILIGSQAQLQQYLERTTESLFLEKPSDTLSVLKSQNYTISMIKNSLPLLYTPYYCRKRGEKGVITRNGIPEEFLLDENICERQSILYNIATYKNAMIEFAKKNKRTIRYVIVEKEEGGSSQSLYKDAEENPLILFTTKERLISHSGAERFYKFIQGCKYHYDDQYSVLIIEDRSDKT